MYFDPAGSGRNLRNVEERPWPSNCTVLSIMTLVRQPGGSADEPRACNSLRLVSEQPAGRQSNCPSSADSNAEFLTPDQLFSLLDGRTLVTSAGQFTIEVFGVLHDAGCQWAQIALSGPGLHRMLTVRVKPGASIQRAILMLSSWLAFPAEYQDIVHVA
jgi:hypothetical protein